jgi:hypothetical protein
LLDVEFLPTWYPRLRRTERALAGYVMLALSVVGYVAWCCVATHGRVAAAAAESYQLDAQLAAPTNPAVDPSHTAARVAQLLNAAGTLEQIRSKTPMSRQVMAIEEAIPPGVLLTELTIDPPDADAAATQPDGRLVHLRGLAPRVADVANCQAAISRLQSVSQLRLSAARDLPGPGTVCREFEMTFLLSSNGAGE